MNEHDSDTTRDEQAPDTEPRPAPSDETPEVDAGDFIIGVTLLGGDS